MRVHNKQVINSLSTIPVRHPLNNMWAICGAQVDCVAASRIVERGLRLMLVAPPVVLCILPNWVVRAGRKLVRTNQSVPICHKKFL